MSKSEANSFLDALKKRTFQQIEALGEYSLLTAETIRVWIKKPPAFSELTYEMNMLGVQSFLIVFVAALSTGLVLAIQ
ncbi:MAG: hypothetical protein WCK43_09900, partial [bacterium]